jgi:hypothetical protein
MEKRPNRKYELLPLIFIFSSILLFYGCSHVSSIAYKEWTTGIQKGDKLAVLISYKHHSQPSPYEKTICKCISNGFKKLKTKVEIISTEQFRSFSFLDIKLAKNLNTQIDINHMFVDPSVVEQIERLDIRYIVLVDDPATHEDVKHSKSGWEWGSGGYPYPGIVPVYTKEKITEVVIVIKGIIFDYKHRRISGEIYSSSAGESGYLFMPPLGFGYPSGVSLSQVCNEFGKVLAEFIVKQEITY